MNRFILHRKLLLRKIENIAYILELLRKFGIRKVRVKIRREKKYIPRKIIVIFIQSR